MSRCLVCSSTFYPKRKGQIYCGSKCNRNASHRRDRGFNIKNLEFSCVVCERRFIQKRANHTEYCDYYCKRLAGSRRRKGISIKGIRRTAPWGKGYINNRGYKVITKNHPNATSRTKNGKGQILEHIWIMSNHIGRPLYKHERVHHKNGIRSDNRIDNLELWSHSHPPGQRLEDKISWAKEFLNEYNYDVIQKKDTTKEPQGSGE